MQHRSLQANCLGPQLQAFSLAALNWHFTSMSSNWWFLKGAGKGAETMLGS
jgi:hypothetical protein